MPNCLVLLDIDGTLLSTDGEARQAFRQALQATYGTAGPIGEHPFAGKTDPQIARELLAAAGVEDRVIGAGLDELWRRYLEALAPRLQSRPPRLCRGVTALLDRIDRSSPAMIAGLLTGNIRGGARVKLQAAGLEFERFSVGAFGCDSADRRRLPEVAMQRASRLLGRVVEPDSVVVVGDTPADIDCARHCGARAVAVATGVYGAAELAAHEPDALLESLADPEAAWEVLLASA